MVYRIYVEKKPGFDVEATGLKNELTSLLGIQSLTGLRLLNRYDVEGIDEELFNQCANTVFSEPPVDNTYAELPASDGVSFAVEYLPGQFDQRAERHVAQPVADHGVALQNERHAEQRRAQRDQNADDERAHDEGVGEHRKKQLHARSPPNRFPAGEDKNSLTVP